MIPSFGPGKLTGRDRRAIICRGETMPWKRRETNKVPLRTALLLGALALAGGVLACWIGSGSLRLVDGLAGRRTPMGVIAAGLAERGK